MTERIQNSRIYQTLTGKFPWMAQFIRFGFVGVSNTLIGLAVYYLLAGLFSMDIQLSNAISFVVSVLNAYIWNTVWVFKKQQDPSRKSIRTPLKFFISYGTTYLLSAVLLWLWTDVLGISKFLAPLISLLITVPVNFLLNKFWTFKAVRN
ncbi:MAG: GtrA family protein [Clostridiaceae bacterium]|nr:GtrA family protein [Clostridiaceae bacterium]